MRALPPCCMPVVSTLALSEGTGITCLVGKAWPVESTTTFPATL
jgi:hypothetical protein